MRHNLDARRTRSSQDISRRDTPAQGGLGQKLPEQGELEQEETESNTPNNITPDQVADGSVLANKSDQSHPAQDTLAQTARVQSRPGQNTLAQATPDQSVESAKRALRAQIKTSRDAISPQTLSQSNLTRTKLVCDLAEQLQAKTLACYLSVPPEPDTHTIVETLITSRRRVLVPVLSKAPRAGGRRVPAWAEYLDNSTLVSSWSGIQEPTGEILPDNALSTADLVIVSALAGGRDGYRLGIGGGWYDQALKWVSQTSKVVALLHDGELFSQIPHQEHDRKVDGFVLNSEIVWINQLG